MIGSLHVPGHSLLHRLPAGVKLLGLSALGLALVFTPDPWILLGALGVVFLAYPLSGLGWRAPVRQGLGLLPLIALIAGTQAWLVGWQDAVMVSARLAALLLSATLVSLTTPLAATLAVLERLLAPLAWLGLAPRAVAFALGLTIRFVPVLGGLLRETREAAAARGRDRVAWALLVPLILRALRLADQVSEAVEARGLETHAERAHRPQSHLDDGTGQTA
ncbi:energy-coupling factor transporter transmembrane component T family protein [Pararhodospirillum oryzae]|uniref:Cobalt ABC transporter n=1 Tax=Pararhodospirillum oryzae TaxID=478448 RepID=A0A512H603_9PROT|nr:energy-coupling factor transporter transmembrane protein EcfT [Pararhodospirillum oryzae]GEO80861.1 cobalt ABC transporter [Pararhodospirillum oryzae]